MSRTPESVDGPALDNRSREVALKLAKGTPVNELATEYGVTRVTIWRWANHAYSIDLPAFHEREAWRSEVIPMLVDSIAEAKEARKHRDVAALTDRLAKLLGLDHADALNEAMLRIKTVQAGLAVRAVTEAMAGAGLSREQQAAVIEGMRAHVAALPE